jgi:hypothetical protein
MELTNSHTIYLLLIVCAIGFVIASLWLAVRPPLLIALACGIDE